MPELVSKEPFQPRDLDAMSAAELRVWIRALLEGRHPFQLKPDTVTPANLLVHAFLEVRGDTRRVLQHVVTEFLQALIDEEVSSLYWRTKAGVELIRAIPSIVSGAFRDRAVNQFLQLVSEWDETDDAVDIDFRLVALGGLLDLFSDAEEAGVDLRVGQEFWESQPVQGPRRLAYFATVLEGISRSSVDDAFIWLSNQQWDADARAALEYIAPTLMLSPSFGAALSRHAQDLESEIVTLLRTSMVINARPLPWQSANESEPTSVSAKGPDLISQLRAEHEQFVIDVYRERQRVWEPKADLRTLVGQIYTLSYGQQVERFIRERF